jgi:uncharacterized membrane protein YeaQ/YmgE (transglycosylase-associated protein family)
MTLLNILLWILFGAVAGWLASVIMARDARMGLLSNIVVGVIGALIGGFVMNAFGTAGITGFNIYSLLVATLGAIILLVLLRLFRRAS